MSTAVQQLTAQFYRDQVLTVLGMVQRQAGHEVDSVTTLPASDYRDQDRLQREWQMFRRLPLLVAHSSELIGAGSFKRVEVQGRSWLLTRDADGGVHAMLNYCQHRGTKLEHSESGCKKRFVCPYHSWTYNLKGELVGLPRADLFPGLDKASKPLKRAAHVQEAFGFIWLQQEGDQTIDVNEYLGDLVPELKALQLEDYHVFFDQTRDLNANWKFPIYAFLESYHIGTLHKNSIAEFFVENVAMSETFGPHIRSFVPRKNVIELTEDNLHQHRIADYITPTNILFPNICMIGHPNAYTVIAMFPGDTPGTSQWRHMLLIPKEPETEQEQKHYEKTVAVLDGMTYEAEDFWVSEQLQEGINAGAIDELVLAKNEHMIKHFADTVDAWL